MRINQQRLYLATFTGVLMTLLRQAGLQGTALARAQADTIHTRLLKVGARIIVSRCRARIAFASVYLLQRLFAHVLAALRAPPADRPPVAPTDALTGSAAAGFAPRPAVHPCPPPKRAG